VQKFAGIIYSCPPTSGEVCDDDLMDRYYARMRHEYRACSKSYLKDIPKTFDKLKSYHFLSKHPKFEVEFPTDRWKPPPKHPNSVQKADLPDHLSDTNLDPDSNKKLSELPTRRKDLLVESIQRELMQ
jgi:hypothetical protein